MSMTNAVSENGRVTIPKRLRTQLGISTGTVLAFTTVNGKLVAEKKNAGNALKNWRGRGRLQRGLSVDGYLSRSRDGRSC